MGLIKKILKTQHILKSYNSIFSPWTFLEIGMHFFVSFYKGLWTIVIGTKNSD